MKSVSTRTFLGSPAPTIRNTTSATLTPAAGANTPGAARTITPGGRGLLQIQQLTVTFAGTFGSETATALVTINFADGTSASSFGLTATGASAPGVSSNDIAGLMKDGTLIRSVTVTLQSTIASSLVTAVARVVGLQV